MNHYIIPIKNFKIYPYSKNFEYDFENPKVNLKYFAYEDDIERIDADKYSTCDHGILKMEYSWGLRFDCQNKDLDLYIEKINLLMLSFRIFEEADCSFEYILNVTDTYSSIKNPDRWKRSLNTVQHSSNFTIETLDKVKSGYSELQEFYYVSARTKHCIQFLYLAYISYYWMQAFILFMTAIETLVSPDIKSDKITSLIINRILGLIANDSICSKNQLNTLYELRSDIIHGKVITDIQLQKEMPKLVRLQKVVLTVFNNILKRDFKTIYSNNIEFENFFN